MSPIFTKAILIPCDQRTGAEYQLSADGKTIKRVHDGITWHRDE